jgi:hypothetical protein
MNGLTGKGCWGYSDVLCAEAGMAKDQLFAAHKGSQQLSRLRDRIIHVATRHMYYPASELARFLNVTPPAVTLGNRRLSEKTGIILD